MLQLDCAAREAASVEGMAGGGEEGREVGRLGEAGRQSGEWWVGG